MAIKYTYNPFQNRLDAYQDLTETIPITDLSDVTITSAADNDLLQYNSTTSVWENVSVLDIPEIYNSLDTLKIMPDVQGDVELFGDTDVADGAGSRDFIIHRCAAEGDDWIKINIDNDQVGHLTMSYVRDFKIKGASTTTGDGGDLILEGADGGGGGGAYDGGDVTLAGGTKGGAGTDGSVVITGTVDWTGITGNIDITANDFTTTGTAYIDTIDFGTNTITDANMTGNWAFNSGVLDSIGDFGAVNGAFNGYVNIVDYLHLNTDSALLKFGTFPTGDATMGFDGNSLNIIANAVTATDGLEIEAGYVSVFKNDTVGDDTAGRTFSVYRKATEHTKTLDFNLDTDGNGQIATTGDKLFLGPGGGTNVFEFDTEGGNTDLNLTFLSRTGNIKGSVSAAGHADGFDVTVTGGDASAATDGDGGDLNLAGGALDGTGASGSVAIIGSSLVIGEEVWVPDGGSIQTVITAITDATSSKPYTVRVPPGVYTEQITLKDYVSLKGAGMYATKITHDGDAGDDYSTIFYADQVTISDMTVESTSTGICIGNFGQAGLANNTFYVRNCYLDTAADLVYSVQTGVTAYIFDTIATTAYDGFVIVGGGSSNNFYIYNTKITVANSANITYGIFRSDVNGSNMYVYNSYVDGSITNDSLHEIFSAHGGLRIFDTYVNIAVNIANDIYGVSATNANSDIEVYGGSINVTNAGAGDAYDLYRSDGTLNVYGTEYSTSSGTIGGFGMDDNNMELYAGNLTTTGNIRIASDTGYIDLGATANDYKIQWDGSDAVHTITAGDFVFTGGNVGMGTATPTSPLHIEGAGGADTFGHLKIVNSTGTANAGFYIDGGAGNSISRFLADTDVKVNIVKFVDRENTHDQIDFGQDRGASPQLGAQNDFFVRNMAHGKSLLFGSTTAGGVTSLNMQIDGDGNMLMPNDNAYLSLGATATDLKLYSDGTDGRIDVTGKLIIDADSDTECLRLAAADAANDYADFYVNVDGELVIMPTARNVFIGDGTDGDNALNFWGDTSSYSLVHDDDDGTLTVSASDAANYARFAADGELSLAGTARVKKNLVIPMEGGQGTAAPTARTAENPYLSWTFAINDDNEHSFIAPHDMDYTQDVVVYVTWYTSVSQADDEVNWQLEWNARATGETVNAGATTDTSGDVNCPAQWVITETAVETIAGNSIAADDCIGFDLKRIAIVDGTDPQVNTIHVLSIHAEYISNKLGEAT